MLRWQLKIALSRRETKVALMINMGLAILSFALSVVDALTNGNELSRELPAYAYFMLHSSMINNTGVIYLMIAPLLAALPFADSMMEERQCNMHCAVLTRCRKDSYIWAKAGAVLILGALITVIPAALNLIWCQMVFPAYSPRNSIGTISSMTSYDYFIGNVYLSNVYASHPYLYAWACTLNVGMYGGICALMAFALSLYASKHRLLVIAMPFFIIMFASAIQQTANSLYLSGNAKALPFTYFLMAEDSQKLPFAVNVLIWASLAVAASLIIGLRTKDADVL